MNALRRFLCVAGLCLGLGLSAGAGGSEAFRSVYISEFLADNRAGLRDEDADHSPWIELHNGGSATVNLAGWFLTGNTNNLTRWRCPDVTLLPDKFLLVFASGKDRTKDPAHLHANFRFTNYLALVNPASNVVSEFSPAESAPDVSEGCARGEPALRGRFVRPTPGRPNATSGTGFAPEISFSKAGGNFLAPFPLDLSVPATGAVVRFTLDGSMPTRTSAVWAGPMWITNTAQLRARAYAEGLLPGPPRSEVYVRLLTNVLGFTSTLPVLVLDTFGKESPISSRGSFVHLSFFEPIQGTTSLTNAPAFSTRGGFHIRGSTSAGMPQSGFAVEFLDEFNDERHLAALGMPADSDWVLYAPNGYDPVMIHNPFIHQLSRDIGRYSPRTRFVEVFLVRTAGRLREAHYNGVYVLEEKIKMDRNRVNIDRVGAGDLKPPQVTGGYLLKFDRLGPGESGFAAGGPTIVHVDPKESTIDLPQRAAQRQYLHDYFGEFQRVLEGAKWKDPAAGYAAYVDVEAAIDYHVVEVLSGNVDAMVFSAYFQKVRNGKIVWGPHWDFDRALGSTDGRDANPRQWDTGPFFSAGWWPRLLSDPDFWQRWVDRWQELRRVQFSNAYLHGLIDRLAGEVREAQPREYKRWGLQPRGGSFQSEIDHMKDWLANRVEFIDHQLTAQPLPSIPGGRVVPGTPLTLHATTTNATIYYTLNGSDPRLAQGGVSSNAFVYTGPISLQTDVHLVARARDPKRRQTGGPPTSTPWSGPVKADFTVGP